MYFSFPLSIENMHNKANFSSSAGWKFWGTHDFSSFFGNGMFSTPSNSQNSLNLILDHPIPNWLRIKSFPLSWFRRISDRLWTTGKWVWSVFPVIFCFSSLSLQTVFWLLQRHCAVTEKMNIQKPTSTMEDCSTFSESWYFFHMTLLSRNFYGFFRSSLSKAFPS